jgi:hypothetical protein
MARSATLKAAVSTAVLVRALSSNALKPLLLIKAFTTQWSLLSSIFWDADFVGSMSNLMRLYDIVRVPGSPWKYIKNAFCKSKEVNMKVAGSS